MGPSVFGYILVTVGKLSGGRSSRGFIQARLQVVAFFSVPVGLIRSAMCLAVYFVFTWVHSGVSSGRRVHLGACELIRRASRVHSVSSGFIGCA